MIQGMTQTWLGIKSPAGVQSSTRGATGSGTIHREKDHTIDSLETKDNKDTKTNDTITILQHLHT